MGMRIFGLGPRAPVAETSSKLDPASSPPSSERVGSTEPPLAPRAHHVAAEPSAGLAGLIGAHRASISAVMLGASSLLGAVHADAVTEAQPSTAATGTLLTRPQVLRELAQKVSDGLDASEVAALKAMLSRADVTPGAKDAITVLLSKVGQATVEPGRTAALGAGTKVEAGTKGAYFRKVTSDAQVGYSGIRAEGHLPVMHFDPSRFYVSKHGLDHYETGPLDRPSIYLGGRTSGVEMDVGLTWDRVYDGKQATYTDRPELSDGRDPAHRFSRATVEGQPALVDGHGKVVASGAEAVADKLATLSPNYAFRPVWRAIADGENAWGTPALGSADNVYFYPGEKFAMRVEVVGKEQVELSIRPVGVPGAPGMSHTFAQDGAGVGGKQSFKRVSSIDQFYVREDGSRKGRERLDVLGTGTTALGGGWDAVEILRSGADPLPMRGASMHEVRGGDTVGRYDTLFHRYATNVRGGERVDIVPGK